MRWSFHSYISGGNCAKLASKNISPCDSASCWNTVSSLWLLWPYCNSTVNQQIFRGVGNSLLAVIIILGIMILPTIINISEVALRTVPREYKEGSLALGATHIQTVFKVVLPAARSGIMTSIILGAGRAIGETMAVIMVAGNTPLLPSSLLKPVRTMTSNIVLEMGYAFGLHQEALFATGAVLFIFIMVLNIVLNIIHKAGESYE